MMNENMKISDNEIKLNARLQELEDLRAAKANATPEEVKRINGVIRGKSINLKKLQKLVDEEKHS